MKRMALAATLISALLISAVAGSQFIGSTSAQEFSADWSMFRLNSAHTGVTTSTGPTQPVKLWSYVEGHFDGSFIGSSAAIVDGVVYVGSNEQSYETDGGNIYAFNAYTGAKIWNYSTSSPVYSSPAVSGNLLFIGSWDYNVYAFNASTGAKIWNCTTGNWINSSPNVVSGVVYIGSLDNNVYALNASTGAKIWNYYTNPSRLYGGGYFHGVTASPAVANGVVYIGDVDGNMYALNASTGEHIWQEKIFTVLSSAAVSEGVVYVGGFEYVYALNATTGSQIWVFPTQNQINSSPAVFDGVIYIGSQDGNFYAIGEPIVGPKPFPVVWITAALGVVVAVVGIGLLVYFKKRGRTPH